MVACKIRYVCYSIIVCIYSLAATAVEGQTIADSIQSTTNNEIAFTSDTQAPMWVETLWLKANHNRAATKSIFNNILVRQPKALFILGDVVSLGYSNKQWKPMDAYLARLRAKGVQVYAALGNHEVMGQSKKGQQKFQQRFPNHVNTGYVQIVDSIAVILLNSNFKSLSAAENARQIDWYKSELVQLDSDSSIKFIITGCHHSPYTNSSIVRSSIGVREKFVPLFLKSQKSLLFLSGHSHNFEHYKMEGKDFIVIGGGGGLHQPLKQGKESLNDVDINYKPMFHYLTVRRSNDTLQLESLMLNPATQNFEGGLKLSITKPTFPVSATN